MTQLSTKNYFYFAQQFHKVKFSSLRPLLSITFPQGFQKSKKVLTLDFAKWGQKDR